MKPKTFNRIINIVLCCMIIPTIVVVVYLIKNIKRSSTIIEGVLNCFIWIYALVICIVFITALICWKRIVKEDMG